MSVEQPVEAVEPRALAAVESPEDSGDEVRMSGVQPTRPRLLDLFCGAGGCAKGYQRAGFYVVGVDIKPQPNYCGDEFYQDDALRRGDSLSVALGGFAAIHASPPCQASSSIAKQQRALRPGVYDHPELIPETRELLVASGLPYVIENVVGAALKNPIMLCGSSFGLNLRRHRLFESNVSIMAFPCAHYWQTPRFRSLDQRPGRKKMLSTIPVHGTGHHLASVVGVHGHTNYPGERELREEAMGIDWMTTAELSQAIPPAYTEHIGQFLKAEVERRALERVA